MSALLASVPEDDKKQNTLISDSRTSAFGEDFLLGGEKIRNRSDCRIKIKDRKGIKRELFTPIRGTERRIKKGMRLYEG
jgi:hypothetical protein